MKKPWLAAVLNIIPGVGYLYLGTRRNFAILLLASALMSLLVIFDQSTANDVVTTTPWDVLSTLTFGAAFVVDGYFEAKRINKKPTSKKRTK